MRNVVIGFLVFLALAIPLAADCPTVYNLDDPPCVPCQSVVISITDESGDWAIALGAGTMKIPALARSSAIGSTPADAEALWVSA